MNKVTNWQKRAQAEGWVTKAFETDPHSEPSPLLATLVLLGALVCSVPVLAFLGSVFGEILLRTPLGYVVGTLCMIGSLWALRRTHHIFATCVALEVLGLGLALLVMLWLHDSGGGDAAVLAASLFVIAALLLSATVISELWVVRVAGFLLAPAVLAALAMALKVMGVSYGRVFGLAPAWLALAAAPWAWWCWNEERWLGKAQSARQAALAAGYVSGLLVHSLVLGAWLHVPQSPAELAGVNALRSSAYAWPHWLAVLLVLISGWVLLRRWSEGSPSAGVRSLLGLAFAVAAVCSWFSPVLGTVALVAALAAASARWRLLASCGVVALGLLSSFYYNMAWPLAAKGLGLAVLGVVLGLSVVFIRPADRSAASLTAPASRRGTLWILLGGLVALGVANVDVWQKENVIAGGERILVRLVPVDPRSLMQGDYMRLRFDIPAEIVKELERSAVNSVQWSKRAVVVAKVNDRREAQLLRLASEHETPGEGEVLLPLRLLKGSWVLVTDAYFFPEGQGHRFEQARFGEIRALPGGRALLVGLADEHGRSIPPGVRAEHEP